MKTILKWTQLEKLEVGGIAFCPEAYRNVRIVSCNPMGFDGYFIEATHL